MSTRRTLLYRETGKRNSAGANILTRGGDVRKADPTLLPCDDTTSVVDIHCGQFWISNLPDLTHSNEAYLEITVITTKQNKTHEIKIPHMFKYQIEVEDQSFCSNISGAELLAGIGIYSDGFEFQCRLTELDKIDANKFNKIKGFVDKNDLTTLAQQLLASAAPLINTQQLLNMIYDTAEIIDEINDDDRVWLERPKIDLRQQATNPLYEGWYAFVNATNDSEKELPLHLYEINGELFKDYQSQSSYNRFLEQSYLTWHVIRETRKQQVKQEKARTAASYA